MCCSPPSWLGHSLCPVPNPQKNENQNKKKTVQGCVYHNFGAWRKETGRMWVLRGKRGWKSTLFSRKLSSIDVIALTLVTFIDTEKLWLSFKFMIFTWNCPKKIAEESPSIGLRMSFSLIKRGEDAFFLSSMIVFWWFLVLKEIFCIHVVSQDNIKLWRNFWERNLRSLLGLAIYSSFKIIVE